MNMENRTKLVELLRTVGPAHHQAYIATDSDWPEFYADEIMEYCAS